MVLVYGGSFNPPTKAHQLIIESLIQKYKPNRFIILPVGHKYTWKDNLLPFEYRYEMLQLIFKHNDLIDISDIENRDDFKGTYHSLKQVQKTHPKEKIFFIIGTDHLKTMHLWKNYEALLNEFSFIIVKRPKYELSFEIFKRFNTYYEVFEFESDISSSRIRDNIEKYKNDLDDKVYQYIIQHKLYQGEKL
ncbi:nicotinate (nicotinamide) nucleotide adenylyltransferase [Acholeplasma equifetale]|uniref:nicotinate (nicotinamide) nucleotide adenylyltransferase n=1 Tax=Acholeplasma equifetale TaxID=264634 RepID=UPI00138AD6E2|nr:nicotinate (nicotinamide) nucleotide adenylyltransferase [Acholeplasma equifetale]